MLLFFFFFNFLSLFVIIFCLFGFVFFFIFFISHVFSSRFFELNFFNRDFYFLETDDLWVTSCFMNWDNTLVDVDLVDFDIAPGERDAFYTLFRLFFGLDFGNDFKNRSPLLGHFSDGHWLTYDKNNLTPSFKKFLRNKNLFLKKKKRKKGILFDNQPIKSDDLDSGLASKLKIRLKVETKEDIRKKRAEKEFSWLSGFKYSSDKMVSYDLKNSGPVTGSLDSFGISTDEKDLSEKEVSLKKEIVPVDFLKNLQLVKFFWTTILFLSKSRIFLEFRFIISELKGVSDASFYGLFDSDYYKAYMPAARAFHGETAALVQRIARRHRHAVGLGAGSRVERPLADGQGGGEAGSTERRQIRLPRRRHPEQGRFPSGSGALSSARRPRCSGGLHGRRRRAAERGRLWLPATSARVVAPIARAPEPPRNAPTWGRTVGTAAGRSAPRPPRAPGANGSSGRRTSSG